VAIEKQERARREGRADDILAAFTRRVARYGYDGTNFSDIAAELSISKGTIVHHFGTKERLLGALHEQYMVRRNAEMTRLVGWSPRPDHQLAAVLFALMLYQEHDRDATVAFQREVMRLPALGERGLRLRADHLESVREVLRSGVAQGLFRDVDIDLQSLLLFGSAHWAYTWFEPTGRFSATQMGSALVQSVLGGLLVDRGNLDALAAPDGAAAAAAGNALS
jgi:AcrR family transcriptional regulator